MKLQLHSAGAASRLAALLLVQILPVFSLVAPCHPGASPPSVRRWTFTTGRQHDRVSPREENPPRAVLPDAARIIGIFSGEADICTIGRDGTIGAAACLWTELTV